MLEILGLLDVHSDDQTDDQTDALGGVLGGALAVAQAGPGEDPTYPGLPIPRAGWSGTSTTGLAYVPRSKQYFQVPTVINPIDVFLTSFGTSTTPPLPPGFQTAVTFNFNGHLKSPPGAAHPYGEYPPIRTRVLAFGILPVEATIYVTQLRDANNLPVPITLSTLFGTAKTTNYLVRGDGHLAGQVQLRLGDLTIDGQPVDVGDHCLATGPSKLTATGLGFWQGTIGGSLKYWKTDGDKVVGPTPTNMLTAQQVQKERYQLPTGGPLNGTLTVAPFAGCTGPSGDISAIVNSAVAGDQPTTIIQGPAQVCFPPTADQCILPDPIPYPTTAP